MTKLYKPETEAVHVRTLKELKDIVGKRYNKAIELAHGRIAAEHDALVYESYTDVALPWRNIRDLDMVLAVHPRIHSSIRPRQIPLSPRPGRKPDSGSEDREHCEST